MHCSFQRKPIRICLHYTDVPAIAQPSMYVPSSEQRTIEQVMKQQTLQDKAEKA